MRVAALSKCLVVALLTAILAAASLPLRAHAQEPAATPAPATNAPHQMSFAPIAVPTGPARMGVRTTPRISVEAESYPVQYQAILRSGDRLASGTFGQLVDRTGAPIVVDGQPLISNAMDYTSILPRGEKIYLVTHFENTPGAMYLTEATQDPDTGALIALDTRPLDFSAVGGVLEVCAGVTTPWSSHLGSEEWDPDARDWDPATGAIDDEDYDEGMQLYLGADGDLAELTPYAYGWTPEVFVDAEGNASVTKHYALGRFAHELAYVMPDEQTVYMTDDETNGALFLFVADQPADLSRGSLYAAKWQQTDAARAGAADITWIKLGAASDDEIRALIEARVTFADLFEVADPATDGTCSAGLSSINTTTGHECLAVKPGMEQAAAFLESRRYAALLGATTEFGGNEGVAYDAERGLLYIATSGIGDGMLDAEPEYDLGGNNDIRLQTATSCAGIYVLPVAPGQNAAIGNPALAATATEPIASGYVVTSAATELMGNEWSEEEAIARGVDPARNLCDVDGIAEPDNLAFIPGAGTLLIAEDSEEHENDYLWAYNTRTKRLARIQSSPIGSELASPYFHPDVNGWAYLTSVIQHPFDAEELIEDFGHPEDAVPVGDARAVLGIIGPLPANAGR